MPVAEARPLAVTPRVAPAGAATAWPGREVALTDGRTLTIRPVEPGDLDGLRLLYAGLSADDLRLRFFSTYHPPPEFFEELVRTEQDGGYRIVAIADDPRPRLVGEAGYALLPDGDGEFAITVAADWRGWLGPYLLDALVDAAAVRGVPNLQADILVENRRMLALVKHRGFATLDHPDWTVVRVAIGTSQHVPTWSGRHDRPRILVEVPGGRWYAEEACRAQGFHVITCSGPCREPHLPCPVLEGEPCPLATGADLVVFGLPADEKSGQVLAGHRRVHQGVRVWLDAPVAGRSGPEVPDVPRLPAPREGQTVAQILKQLFAAEATARG